MRVSKRGPRVNGLWVLSQTHISKFNYQLGKWFIGVRVIEYLSEGGCESHIP